MKTDDELMQEAYDNLNKVFHLQQPGDPKKLRAWLAAYDLVVKARRAIEVPYKDAVTALGELANGT